MSAHTDNSIEIAVDIDRVWQLTNDLASWPQLFTEYASVEILDEHEGTFRFRLTMHPDENGNAWSWVSERTLDEAARRVTARRIEPGWFEYMNITWTYEVTETGTLMRWVQDFSMRSDSPLDDAAMSARINHNTTIQMAHIRDHIEKSVSLAQPA